MSRHWILALCFVLVPLLVHADGCEQHTILMPDGKLLICTTCTYAGQSQTTCF